MTNLQEALTINEWRFAKLKEYKEANIEAENEAFDRYMQNINLLKEVFDVNSERPDEDEILASNPPTTSGEKKELISEMKVILRSNPMRSDTFRKRIRQTIDQGLSKLKTNNAIEEPNSLDKDAESAPKAAKNCSTLETSALTELNYKLNRARNEDDLKLCIQMRLDINSQQKISQEMKTDSSVVMEEHTAPSKLPSAPECDFPLKMVKSREIDQDVLSKMDFHFSSIEEIEDL